MKKDYTTQRLIISVFLLAIYIGVFFIVNFSYISGLNEYFNILQTNSSMIYAINTNRAELNRTQILWNEVLAIIGIVLVLFVLDNAKNIINKYKDLAYKDQLTGAYNRTYLNKVFDDIEKRQQTDDVTYILIDMNYMKQLNDGYSHKIGDYYLVALTNCLKSTFGKNAKVFRLGGDEFVVLYVGNDFNPETYLKELERKREEWNKEKPIELPLSFSKGVVTKKWDFENKQFRDSLYADADEAMYVEKEEFHRLHPREEKIEKHDVRNIILK